MRVAIFVHQDYDFNFDLLNALIPKLRRRYKIAGICCFPDKLTKYSGIRTYLEYLKIFGLMVFIKLLIVSLTKRCKLIGNYIVHRRSYYSFEGMCRYYGITKLNYQNPNDNVVINWIRDNNVDVILSFIGYVLKDNIIQAPQVCILNKHAALLPSNKGVFPIFWALLNDEPMGITIHKVNKEIDGGEIVLQKKYAKHSDWSVYDYYKLVFSETPNLILESLDLIEKDQCNAIESNLRSSYYGLPTRADYRDFKRKGFKFI